MFFLKEEVKVITLHPSYFGPNMREYLINRLNEEEEGRCTGDHFVICVMDMVDIGEGRVLPGSGQAEYTIKYRAIIWKPFRGETVRLGVALNRAAFDSDHSLVGRCDCYVCQAHRYIYFGRSIVCFYCTESMSTTEFELDHLALSVANELARTFLPTSSGNRTQYRRNTRTMRTKSSRREPVYGLRFLV